MAVVLIAEDNDDVCTVLKRILTRAGFDVVTAPDGTTALEMAIADHPDVVLTDLDMPGLTGLQLAQALRGHRGEPDVPILILSGSLQSGDPRAADAGLCDVMLKPFTNPALVAAVQHLADIGRHPHDHGSPPCPLQQQSATPAARGPLAESLVRLAATPATDAAAVQARLTEIAQLAVDRITAVDYASVTVSGDGGYTTVAANSALARAVDDIQYAEHAGPCVQAADTEKLVSVPDINATMNWPGFRTTALSLGLQTSLSVPLTAAGGVPIAVLNLHSRDAAAMAPLLDAVWALYFPQQPAPTGSTRPQPGNRGDEELLIGLTEASA